MEEVLDELDQYAFVVRTRTGKNSTKRTVCIDIKSKFLRGALQDVLKVVKSISLQEDKPSVCCASLQNPAVANIDTG